MNGYEALEFLSDVIVLGANAVVTGACLTAFQKLRVRALLLIAISAGIAVFSSFADILLLRRAEDDSTYAFLWTGLTVLWTIDIGLYAIGITKLIAWITKQYPGDQDADPNV